MSTLSPSTIRDRAVELDRSDDLAFMRDRFLMPPGSNGKPLLYFTGNSLGLQPESARTEVQAVLSDWARLGVAGHFEAESPWMPYHEELAPPMARIVDGLPSEVVVMNSLTVNLHVLMASFYRPTDDRYQILIEPNAFPSDRYAVRSHLEFRGIDPDKGLVTVGGTDTGDLVDEERIEQYLDETGQSVALMLLGGVNYYSGQVLDMARLCDAAHRAGCLIGLDLAHAAGNVELHLHDWDVDFAAWCSYKYLCGGPGAPAGVFVHERHGSNPDIPRLAGWWGHDKSTRFEMPDSFEPIPGAEGWQMSNPPILAMAPLKASLREFDRAGFRRLLQKSQTLTGFLLDLLRSGFREQIDVITPAEPDRRGAQLSIRVNESDTQASARSVFQRLAENDVVCDWRDPDVIRIAPVPMYNTYRDVAEFVVRLQHALAE